MTEASRQTAGGGGCSTANARQSGGHSTGRHDKTRAALGAPNQLPKLSQASSIHPHPSNHQQHSCTRSILFQPSRSFIHPISVPIHPYHPSHSIQSLKNQNRKTESKGFHISMRAFQQITARRPRVE